MNLDATLCAWAPAKHEHTMGSVMMAMNKMMGVLRYLNVFCFVFFVGRFVHQNVYKGAIGLSFGMV